MRNILSCVGCMVFFFSVTASPARQAAFGNVLVTDKGTTVEMDNGIVKATITKANASVTSLVYNGLELVSGGYGGGSIYWSWNMPNYQNPSSCTYTLTVDPMNNNNSYAEIKLHMTWNGSASTAAMDVDIYYSLTQNASGLYASATLFHPASYPLLPSGEWRMSSYPNPRFDWMTIDSLRNKKMPTAADLAASLPVTGAPAEVTRLTTGVYANQYECKYDYSADFGDIDVWGWSSTIDHVGIWVTTPSKEYYPGGPMKRELTAHANPVLLNMLGGTHYNMGDDKDVAAGEDWQKTFGPFLIYCNKVPAGTANAPAVLWTDAKAQAKIEQAAWPYAWYSNPSYVKANGRGTITGKLEIVDENKKLSPADMWVGVTVQQSASSSIDNFQHWGKYFQWWVKTDALGNFTIPHVLPGTYNLYAFGPRAAGLMALSNYVTVSAGNTAALGTVTWTPNRLAPTVWEIGIPDRSAKEFKHGTDWFVAGKYPNPNWATFMDYTTEFPADITYTIGQSNWATDWNFVQPYNVVTAMNQAAAPEWKIKFNLTSLPTAGSNSSLYVAAASSFVAPVFVKVNGTNITTPTTGVNFPNSSNATIRKGIHGAFGDLRFTFPSSMLQLGLNEISITVRKSGGDVQYDYLRLESPITGAVTPVTSLPSVSEQTKLVVHPNPVLSSLAAYFLSNKGGSLRCSISNAAGVTFHQFTVHTQAGKNVLQADVSQLSRGMYVLHLISKEGRFVQRFMKQ